jgi:hypothetical protein
MSDEFLSQDESGPEVMVPGSPKIQKENNHESYE